jgi:cytochrome b subunit of formate dehydrogenase
MNYSVLFRKIHRIFVLIILVLIIAMAITGTILKYGSDPNGMLRYIHNQLSPFFTIALAVMAFTGTYLYLYPWWAKRKIKAVQKQEQNTEKK